VENYDRPIKDMPTSLNFTGYDSNPLTNPNATDPSLGYDFSNLGPGKETLTSNKGTYLEKTRPNLYRVNSKIPGKFGFLNAGFDKFRPDTQVTAQNTLDQLALGTILAGDPNITRQDIIDLGNRGKTPEQINPSSGGGGGGQYILPINYNTGAAEEDDYTNDFTFRGDGIQRVGKDVTDPRGYAADGGIMGTRARRAFGGIMDRVTGRKAYGLGSIFKKVGKAAKKVLSSDIGKMAIAGAAIYYGGGGRMLPDARTLALIATSQKRWEECEKRRK
jgi:hypothetical protein